MSEETTNEVPKDEVGERVFSTTLKQLEVVLSKYDSVLLKHTVSENNITLFLRVKPDNLGKQWPTVMADIHRGMARLKLGADISKLFYLDSSDILLYQWRLILLAPTKMHARVLQTVTSAVISAMAQTVVVNEFPLVGGSTYSKYETKGVHTQGSGERLVASVAMGQKIR